MEQPDLKINTWGCACQYTQDFDPADAEKWNRHITSDVQLQEIGRRKAITEPPQGKCPACWLGINDERVVYNRDLFGVTDLGALSTTTSASDAELEGRMVEERDTQGNVVMVEAGSRYELRVNPDTGEIYSEPVPVYEPKMRPLTTQELADLKHQRDLNLDALEKVAVKEANA